MATKRRPSAKLEADEELRGFVVKAYPTQEQAKALYAMQVECRLIWNYLVEQHQAHIARCIERSVADGALLPLPERPPKEAPFKDRRAWNKLYKRAQMPASLHVRKIEGYEWPKLTMRADCYAPLRERCATELGRDLLGCISMTRAVIARFSASRVPKKGGTWRPPRFKRHAPPWLEHSMLQVRDSSRLVSGVYGPRGWHDCQLSFSGLKLSCRAGRPIPEGRVIDGSSIVRKADGWYAAVRIARPPRPPVEPTLGVVGVCLGLQRMAVTNKGVSWENPRGNAYTKLCAWMDEEAARVEAEGDANAAYDMRARKKRYQLRMSRLSREIVLAQILPHLMPYSKVVIGTMRRDDVQGPQCALDDDDDGGATSVCGILRSQLIQRLGDRVVQVDSPGVDDSDPDSTARNLVSMYQEFNGA